MAGRCVAASAVRKCTCPHGTFKYPLVMKTILVSFALLISFAANAQQDWPARSVTLINPFAAASAVDVVTRLVAQRLSTNTGKSFLVENRTGASGNIGTEAAAKA